METILVIELITLYGVFIIGALFWVTTEIWGTIKKYKKEKAMRKFDPLDKF
jgi:hypothetical protein